MSVKRPRNIAHRGARRIALENTLEALRVAFEEGADGVEFDVQVTRDGEPVLFHDDDLWPMAGRRGPVSRLLWRELRELDLQDTSGRRGRAPHLSDVIELLETRRGLWNLELKVVGDSAPALVTSVERIFAAVDAEGWLLSSFSAEAIERTKRQLPQVPVAALIDDDPSCDFWGLLASPEDAADFHALHPHGRLMSRLTEAPVPLHVWTLNGAHHWDAAQRQGVAGIITDDPGGLARFLAVA